MDESDKTIVYVLHYNDSNIPVNKKNYRPIMAGNALHPTRLKMVGDDTGDSISAKNYYYSELTGIYWIWKNESSNIVGTCHYRRFYTNSKIPLTHTLKRMLYPFIGLSRKRRGLIYTSNWRYWNDKIIEVEEIEQLMQNFDAILPQHRTLKYTVEKHFSRYHNIEDLILLRKVINDLHPGFNCSFEKMLKQKHLYANNMCILKRDEFTKMCDWLFSILFEFENRIDLKEYTGYQMRLLGFLSERLITTWFIHRILNVKELPLIYFKKFKQK
jgi:hypothetical protein